MHAQNLGHTHEGACTAHSSRISIATPKGRGANNELQNRADRQATTNRADRASRRPSSAGQRSSSIKKHICRSLYSVQKPHDGAVIAVAGRGMSILGGGPGRPPSGSGSTQLIGKLHRVPLRCPLLAASCQSPVRTGHLPLPLAGCCFGWAWATSAMMSPPFARPGRCRVLPRVSE